MSHKIIAILCLLLFTQYTFAVERWGKISKGVHYDHLHIEQLSNGKCKLSIEIENKTKRLLSSYRFKMTAVDIHKSVQWSITLKTSDIEAGGEKTLSKMIKQCDEDNPYKIRFKKK